MNLRHNFRKSLIYLVLIVVVLSCFSCKRSLARLLLGVDLNPAWLADTDIKKDFEKYDLTKDEMYVLDTVSYRKSVLEWIKSEKEMLDGKDMTSELDSLRKVKIRKNANDNLQPVQVRFFEKSGRPMYKMVNCYVDPPMKMDWNVQGSFDDFPPNNIVELKQSYSESLQDIIRHVKSLDNEAVTLSQLPDADYYAIVFWNSFMIKPSKKLIIEIKEYKQRFDNKNIHVIYVNNHNSILWPALNSKQQKAIVEGKLEDL